MPLLRHVGELVGQQLPAMPRVGGGPPKDDVAADGERPGLDGAGRGFGGRPGMDADAAEIAAEALFHEVTGARVERLSR